MERLSDVNVDVSMSDNESIAFVGNGIVSSATKR